MAAYRFRLAVLAVVVLGVVFVIYTSSLPRMTHLSPQALLMPPAFQDRWDKLKNAFLDDAKVADDVDIDDVDAEEAESNDVESDEVGKGDQNEDDIEKEEDDMDDAMKADDVKVNVTQAKDRQDDAGDNSTQDDDIEVEDTEPQSKDVRKTGGEGKTRRCPNVLRAMRQGSWQQSITQKQRQQMLAFYTKIAKQAPDAIPPFTLQRNDSRCGNVSFMEPLNKWRASCNPDGPTPCCYNNVCVSKSQAECTCKNCLDMRRMVFGEYATWRPKDERCPMVPMTKKQICSLLEGRTVLAVGDSPMRRFYIGFLMTVRGDETNGAFPPNVREDVRQRCRGKKMFPTTGDCAGHIDYNAKLCNGRAKAKYISFYHPTNGITPKHMTREVLSVLTEKKSIAVLGIGSHYYLDAKKATEDSLLPLLKRLSAAQVPLNHTILWMGIHAKKNFREGNSKTMKRILDYNTYVEKILEPWGVPVLDTFNMTSGLVLGVDAGHYGTGVQRAKVNGLLHYLAELRHKGQW